MMCRECVNCIKILKLYDSSFTHPHNIYNHSHGPHMTLHHVTNQITLTLPPPPLHLTASVPEVSRHSLSSRSPLRLSHDAVRLTLYLAADGRHVRSHRLHATYHLAHCVIYLRWQCKHVILVHHRHRGWHVLLQRRHQHHPFTPLPRPFALPL